ncbi:MAG TPA: polysaccharide biosynthesis tyrosine autokinase [Anaerolineaceae bacterium]|nr:polysaccharide biosynthesis tyrosine autokinase [Anaerolineaceae bacterium]
MDLKHYVYLLKRWAWLLFLGAGLGIIAGILMNIYQEPVYQATTKLMVVAPSDNQQQLYQGDEQLSQTYMELLATRPIREAASERLGYKVLPSQITIQKVKDAQLIQVSVQDSDPKRAADIANMLITVFQEQNDALQASRFASTEQSLTQQLQQIQEQISGLQNQSQQQTGENLDKQIQQVTDTIASIQTETQTLQKDMLSLQYTTELVPSYDVNGRLIQVTPTPSLDTQVQLTTKRDRLNELTGLLNKYQDIYIQLTMARDSGGTDGGNSSQINTALALYQQIYSNLLQNLETLRLAKLRSTPSIFLVEQAVQNPKPIRPNKVMNIGLGIVVGLLLSGGIAFVIEFTDDTLRTPDEVNHILNLPVLGHIAEMPAPPKGKTRPNLPHVIEHPRSPISEAFRTLRANVEFAGVDTPLKTILITSPGVAEGKTTLAVNLAIVIAQSGKKVILLDADLRHPRVHVVLGIQNRMGLSDVLRDHASLQSVALNWKNNHLAVITSGTLPPNPAEVLSTTKMARLLSDLKDQADMVIVDGPPFMLADASMLAAKVDGVIAVIRPKYTQASAAVNMLDQLERAGARMLGIVLNRIPPQDTNYYYKSLKDYTSKSYNYLEESVSTKE